MGRAEKTRYSPAREDRRPGERGLRRPRQAPPRVPVVFVVWVPSVPDIAPRPRDRQGFAVARPEFFARLSSGGNSGLTSRECITRN